jgi:hypothetical protein
MSKRAATELTGTRIKATLNKFVRVELVETHPLQINSLQIASTGSARMEGLVQHCIKD